MSLSDAGDLFLAAMSDLYDIINPYDQVAGNLINSWYTLVNNAKNDTGAPLVYQDILQATFDGIDHYLAINQNQLLDQTFSRMTLFVQEVYYNADVTSVYHLPVDRILRMCDAAPSLNASVWRNILRVLGANHMDEFGDIIDLIA